MNKELQKQIGKNLKNIRIRKGETMDEVGKVLGISYQQIQRYEKGTHRISADKLALLHKHWGGLPFADFFSGCSKIS